MSLQVSKNIKKYLKQYFKTDSTAIKSGVLIENICEQLGLDIQENKDEVYNTISLHIHEEFAGQVIWDMDYPDDEDLLQSRRSFFEGAQFLIKPSELELELGCIIPGHRFYPFCSQNLFPDEMKLNADGKAVRKKVIELSMRDSHIFHSMLGMEDFNELICRDVDNFDKVIDYDEEPNPILNFLSYNLKSWYKAHSFSNGDAVLMTVTDWEKGKCTLEYQPLSSFRERVGDISAWCQILEEQLSNALAIPEEACFQRTFDQFEMAAFQAKYKADYNLLANPPMHVGGFLAQSKRIYLAQCDRYALFWRKDEREPIEFFEEGEGGTFDESMLDSGMEEDFLKMLGPEMSKKLIDGDMDHDEIMQMVNSMGGPINNSDDSTFDGIMEIMGFSLNDDEFEAYIRDEMFSGKQKLENVYLRCFDDRIQQYYPELEERLFKLSREIWENVEKGYNRFADDFAGKIRHTILLILDKHVAWMRDLEQFIKTPADLPQKKVIELAELTNLFSQTVIALNTDEEVTTKDVKTYQKMLGKLEPVVLSMMDEIIDIVKNK